MDILPSVIEYSGRKYRLQSTKRYYQSDSHNDPERLLHRRIWIDANGPIPDGHHVHHKDGDWTNNDVSNLELLHRGAHSSLHQKDFQKDPSYVSRTRRGLEKAIVAAAEWHGSEQGIEWHRQHGKAVWANRKTVSAVCSVCGTEYQTYSPKHSRFCSHACEQREGYQRAKTAAGECALCGKPFTYNRYRVQKCCSRKCAIHLRIREARV